MVHFSSGISTKCFCFITHARTRKELPRLSRKKRKQLLDRRILLKLKRAFKERLNLRPRSGLSHGQNETKRTSLNYHGFELNHNYRRRALLMRSTRNGPPSRNAPSHNSHTYHPNHCHSIFETTYLIFYAINYKSLSQNPTQMHHHLTFINKITTAFKQSNIRASTSRHLMISLHNSIVVFFFDQISVHLISLQ